MAKLKTLRLLTVKKDSEFWTSIEKHGTASGLHCRLVFSFLTFRKLRNRGAGLREIARETTLHPKTVKNALASLKEIVEKHGSKWHAVEPPNDWFITAKKSDDWAQRLAYMKLLTPTANAKIAVEEKERRFGLNHAAVYSVLRSKAEQGLVKFTSAQAISALLNGVHRKTISSVLADIEAIGLIYSEAKGRRINVTLNEMTAEHQMLFRHREEEEVEPNVTPTPKKLGYEFKNDGFDDWRKLCERRMSQKYAEESIRMASAMNWDRQFFVGELEAAAAEHNENMKIKKCLKPNFGKFFCTKIGWYFTEHEQSRLEAEAQARFEAYVESDEYQRKQEEKKRTIAADPTHRDHVITETSILDRVDLGGSGLQQYRESARLLAKIESCCRDHLGRKVDATQLGRLTIEATKIVIGEALKTLNSFYNQPQRASRNEFEKAIDRVILSRISEMVPIFSTRATEDQAGDGLVPMTVGSCSNCMEVAS